MLQADSYICRAFVRNMDSEAVERSIQEATASVGDNISTLERSLLDIEEHSRCSANFKLIQELQTVCWLQTELWDHQMLLMNPADKCSGHEHLITLQQPVTRRSLDGKLEKRRAELERADKRLSSLAVVRPAYTDEYELLQAELQQLFGEYVQRFRCSIMSLPCDLTKSAAVSTDC